MVKPIAISALIVLQCTLLASAQMHNVDNPGKTRHLKSSKAKSNKSSKASKASKSSGTAKSVMEKKSPIIDLVGKQVHHAWDQNGSPFISIFCNETNFVWNDLTDPTNIVSAVETYGKRIISDEVVQYNWKESPEARDFALAWTFNFETERVYGIIANVFPTFNLDLTADFEVIDGVEVREGLKTCKDFP